MQAYYSMRNQLIWIVFCGAAACSISLMAMGHIEVGMSLIAGSLVAILNFLLLSKQVAGLAVSPGDSASLRSGTISTGVRYLLLGGLFAVFLHKNWFSLPAFLLGLFGIQITLLIRHVFMNPQTGSRIS